MTNELEQKQELRTNVNALVDRMAKDDRKSENVFICQKLLQEIPEDTKVCAFYPLSNEPNIRPFIEEMLERGNEVYLPRFDKNEIVFYKIDRLQDLEESELGIPEPSADLQQLDRSHVDLVLVPGRAFDENGNRLGRGAGGYDKWIEEQRVTDTVTEFIGVAYNCQMVPEVPTEPHDQKMDKIVTSNEVICSTNGFIT